MGSNDKGLRPLTGSAGIGGGDDLADAFLIETLVAVVALEDFQVRPQRAVCHELLSLFIGDEPRGAEAFDAVRLHWPVIAAREGLSQIRVVGERGHRVDPSELELVAGRAEIELAFEMVHSRLQKGFAVQTAPQTDGAELIARWERLV